MHVMKDLNPRLSILEIDVLPTELMTRMRECFDSEYVNVTYLTRTRLCAEGYKYCFDELQIQMVITIGLL